MSTYIDHKIDQKGVAYDGLSWASFIEWCARFVLAPFPTSLLSRLTGGGDDYQFGGFDEIIRIYHRSVLYVLFASCFYYLIGHTKVFIGTVKKMGPIFVFLGVYVATYALFNFGGSHERIKFMFFVCIAAFWASLVLGVKKEKKTEKQYDD